SSLKAKHAVFEVFGLELAMKFEFPREREHQFEHELAKGGSPIPKWQKGLSEFRRSLATSGSSRADHLLVGHEYGQIVLRRKLALGHRHPALQNTILAHIS